jgi:Fe-S oxidoreductase
MAMFVNEYLDLVPGKKSRTVAEMTSSVEALIARQVIGGEISFSFDEKKRRILFHGHCQQKANFGTEDTVDFLNLIPNCQVEEIDAGCCGMAGSFGYEKEHYDLSVMIAELRLAPAIRELDEGTIVCATGTSCRDQIKHTTNRHGLHPVEIFADAII